MRSKIVNSIYFCALFLELLCVSMPVLPSWTDMCALCMFVIYMMIEGIQINTAYKNWTLTYVIFFLLSAIWAIVPKFSLFIIIVRLIPIFAMVFATFTYVKKNSTLNGVFFVVYVVGLVTFAYLITHMDEFVEGVRFGADLNSEDDDIVWNSNSIGINFCFAVLSGFIFFVNQNRKVLIRFFYYITALLLIIAILLTGSRKAFIMLVIPIFYFMFKKQKKHFFLFLLLFPVVIIISYEILMNVDIFYMTIGARLEDMVAIITGNTTGQEDSSRSELIKYGIDWFWDNPILGVGLHNFRVLSNQTSQFAGRYFYAHNNYIELLVDVGIIGLFLYYRAYFYLFFKLKGKEDTLSYWGMSFLLILFFLGIGEVLYYEPFEQLFFCLIFCIIEFNNIIMKEVKYDAS